jgi:hypothetical protein
VIRSSQQCRLEEKHEEILGGYATRPDQAVEGASIDCNQRGHAGSVSAYFWQLVAGSAQAPANRNSKPG